MAVPLRSPKEMQDLVDRSDSTSSNKAVLTLFLAYLVPDNINPAPTKHDLESIVYSSIRGIANMFHHLASDAALASILTQPTKWCHVVHRTEELIFSSSRSSETDFQNEVVFFLLSIMCAIQKREELAEGNLSDRDTYRLLFRIWSMTATIRPMHVYCATYLIQTAMTLGIVVTDDAKRVCSVLNTKLTDLGDPDTVARSVLHSVVYHFQEQPFNIPLLDQITCLLCKLRMVREHLVAVLLFKEKIINHVARVLASPQLDGSRDADALNSLVQHGMQFMLLSFVFSKNLGPDVLLEALESGFLEALLKLSPSLLRINPKLYGDTWDLLRCYLVYPSVIKSAAKAYGKFCSTLTWSQGVDSQVISDHKSLGDLLLKRLAYVFYVAFTDKNSKRNICAFCKADSQSICFKRCAGCQAEMYCSTDCQLSDWKCGGHRHVCKKMSSYYQETDLDLGKIRKPMAFVNRLAQLEVRERMEELRAMRASEFSDVAFEELAVCVDFTKYRDPVIMKIRPLEEICGPDDGGFAIYNDKISNRLWKEARDSKGALVLAKATIIDGSGTITQYLTTSKEKFLLPYEGRLSLPMLFTEDPVKTVKDAVVEFAACEAIKDMLSAATS